MHLRMTKGVVFMATAASLALAAPAAAKTKEEFHKANFSGKCELQGKLKELLREPYKCYLNLAECGAARDAIAGKLDAGMRELLADLVRPDMSNVKSWSNHPVFIWDCRGPNSPEYIEGLGIQGIGFGRMKEHAGLLADLTQEAILKKTGAINRTYLAWALWGAGDKDKAVPALQRLVEADARLREFKGVALLALARWQSDAAVPYCTKALTSETDTSHVERCIEYLAARKVKAAIPVMVRNMEKYKETVVRALGQIGDASGKAGVKTYLEETAKSPWVRAPGLVAAINLGDESAWAEYTLLLNGKKPEVKKDKPAKAKKRGKKAKASGADEEMVDDRLLQVAAMESVFLVNPKHFAKAKAILAKHAAKKSDKEWKIWVYPTLAMAQRGDAKAAKELVAALDSSKTDIREAVINGIGGLDLHLGSNVVNRGLGVVPSAELAQAMLKYYDTESNKQKKEKALYTAFAIEAYVANMKK